MGKTIVFNSKIGIRKFGSTALPFSKVVYMVKVYYKAITSSSRGYNLLYTIVLFKFLN